MVATKGLNDLLITFMQHVYSAERQNLKSLQKMSKAATSPLLKAALTCHYEETKVQVERLQTSFEALGRLPRGVTCKAINGLIEEAEAVMQEYPEGAVRDAGLAACALAVVHYEIARYGALIAWAGMTGQKVVASLLEETLAEEEAADTLLNRLAGQDKTPKALRGRAGKLQEA
jgi:ferritin-like metal-binding protein YciE